MPRTGENLAILNLTVCQDKPKYKCKGQLCELKVKTFKVYNCWQALAFITVVECLQRKVMNAADKRKLHAW